MSLAGSRVLALCAEDLLKSFVNYFIESLQQDVSAGVFQMISFGDLTHSRRTNERKK